MLSSFLDEYVFKLLFFVQAMLIEQTMAYFFWLPSLQPVASSAAPLSALQQ